MQQCNIAATTATDAPEAIEYNGRKWVRSEISKGRDLINGEDWLREFQKRCSDEETILSTGTARPRRMLRPTASAGDEPQFWHRGDAKLTLADRNRLLQTMERRCGRLSKLPTGEEVIFWFNIGPFPDDSQPRDKVFVTGATCPHQGVPLDSGELREIEDLHQNRKACVRCPRHNKSFDIRTGQGQGCEEVLQTYPVRFIDEFQRFYVDVGEADSCNVDGGVEPMEVDELQEPALKRQCLEEVPGPIKPIPTPVRPNRQLAVSHTAM
mmetsp:Transcript_70523/g.131914  ORF Transcript_70523/g.131914 Transcript_70523/m.131914 type:complete len:267 (-) Transcript_70523:22-822(-)